METTLAVLIVLGIFVGIPAVIGFATAGTYVLRQHQAVKVKHTKALGEAQAQTA